MNFTEQTLLAVKSFLAWFMPTTLGVAAKLAFESRYKPLTRKQVITSLIVAVFVGYGADSLCGHYDVNELRGFVVAISALASDTVVQYILLNSNKGLGAVMKRITGIDPEKLKDDKEVQP